jgi:multidrug efflux pump subunit AcrB
VLGPFVNDEYGDVTFALYALKAKGEPQRQLVREAETLRQRLLHVPGVKKVNIIGERPERIFVEFSQARLPRSASAARDIFAALNNQNLVTPAGSIETNGPQVQVRLDGALDDLEKIGPRPIVVGGRTAQAVRHRRRQARLRGPGDLPDPQPRRTRPGARGGDEGALQRPATGQGSRQGGQGHRSAMPLGLSFTKVTDQAVNITEAYDEFMLKFFVALAVVIAVSLISLGFRSASSWPWPCP